MTTAELTKKDAPFIAPIKFDVSVKQIAEMREEYMAPTIDDVDNKAEVEAVHAARMVCVKLRRGVEKYAKEMRDEANKYAKSVIAAERSLTDPISEIEQHLENEEGKVKREAERKAKEAEESRQKMIRSRLDMLSSLNYPGCTEHFIGVDVQSLTPPQWEELLDVRRKAKAEWDQNEDERIAAAEKLAAEQKVESERLAKERAELERQRQEHEKAAAEQKRIADEQLAAERAEIERVKAEQAAAQAKIDAENKRIADEQAAQKAAAELEAFRREAAEKARLDAIAEQERRAAEEKAEADAAEAELKRLEALRPDSEKLLAVANAVYAIELPPMSDNAAAAAQQVTELLEACVTGIRGVANSLVAKKPRRKKA